ncbi:hypothetical protein MNBD_GAMMA12-2130 [hydrothermal vent metagenome]|uniref:Uncharacterized protein n=1 Tax=hydrothermal vent metagenome TaxID=652676 RepID=A0A3B0Y8Z4_9ZZZZ
MAALLFSTISYGQTPEPQEWAMSLISGSFKIGDAKARRHIATSFEKYINSLNSNIPSLTESEIKEITQIKSNLRSKDKIKIKALIQSLVKMPAYHQKLLKEKLSSIEKALKCAGSLKSNEIQEMYCWALANYYLTENQSINSSLNQLHKLKGFSFSKKTQIKHMIKLGKENTWWFYHHLGRAIQEKIILRYLSSKKYNKAVKKDK